MKYRANLFSENIAKQIETDSIDIAKRFQHALVEISDNDFQVEFVDGERHKYSIKSYEKNSFTTSHVGQFQNGAKFRLIQPIGVSLEMAKLNHNAFGGFSLGSVDPSGWSISFFLTEQNDIRQTNVSKSGSNEQIQRLIQGAMMSMKLGMVNKYIEYSKRLLPMIKGNPSELSDFEDGDRYTQLLKLNKDHFSQDEKRIINNI